jgi:hypothetical protein
MSKQKEFGDFQTPVDLAGDVVALLASRFGAPMMVVEPTCGLGSFIEAAYAVWGESCRYSGSEINPDYCIAARQRFAERDRVAIMERDFFSTDWEEVLTSNPLGNVFVLGNPPWVTNSELGSLKSSNIPDKANFQGLRGFDAKTGKANFDIAEWMIIRLVEALSDGDVLAMLCKTATARKVLTHFWKTDVSVSEECIYLIDAKKSFDVSVDACLLVLRAGGANEQFASVYGTLGSKTPMSRFGILNGELVANIDDYERCRDIDGFSNYKWRSGIKHDASKVMELNPRDGGFVNGYGEKCDIEDEYVYPLLKSSDLGNGRLVPRKYVIVTQKKVGESTDPIQTRAPKTWVYLEQHSDALDARKSSIYNKRARFSIFGIGGYSFSAWKVAISGLYKTLRFEAVPPVEGKPMMLDDTCYFFPCETGDEAIFWAKLLNSEECIRFLHSLVFFASKRPVNIDVLRRIDFAQLARKKGVFNQAKTFLEKAGMYESKEQPFLVFEDEGREKYETKGSSKKKI